MESPVAVIFDEDGNEVLGKTTDAATAVDAAGTTQSYLRALRDAVARPHPTPSTGVYNAKAQTLSGAGSVTVGGRCVGLRLFAAGGDAEVTVSFVTGTILVRSGTGIDLNPSGIPSDPVVTWVSGTMDVLIEAVT